MGHTHGEDRSTYYMEQLCTIAVCGLLGGVAVMLYYQNILRFILAGYLHSYILGSGFALLALAALRAIGLWLSVRPALAGHGSGHEHEHCHDHGHDHAHSHSHSHLHGEGEHSHVLASGLALQTAAHSHDCEHEHGDGHTHDCGHEHNWNPGRYIVLLLPIVLYFLHLPNEGFTASGVSINASDLDPTSDGRYVENTGLQITKNSARDLIQVISVVKDGPADKAGIKLGDFLTHVTRHKDGTGKNLDKPEVTPLKGLTVEDALKKLKGPPRTTVKLTIARADEAKPQEVEITRAPDIIELPWNALQEAAYTPSSRQYYQGKVVQLLGQYAPGRNDRTFTLVRYKITCCAADARPLPVVIMLDPHCPENLSQIRANEWVKVTGRIEFHKRTDRDEYVTVLVVASAADIQSSDPDPQPYLQ
jgi:uncharacterized membrane protein YcgQ (UPF0703/DUF1980 family)